MGYTASHNSEGVGSKISSIVLGNDGVTKLLDHQMRGQKSSPGAYIQAFTFDLPISKSSQLLDLGSKEYLNLPHYRVGLNCIFPDLFVFCLCL